MLATSLTLLALASFRQNDLPIAREGWREEVITSRNSESFASATTDQAGNFITAGTVQIPGESADVMVWKRDPLGKKLWQTQFDFIDRRNSDSVVRVLTDAKGDVYVVGQTPLEGRPGATLAKLNGQTGKLEFRKGFLKGEQLTITAVHPTIVNGFIYFAGGSGSNGREKVSLGRWKLDGTMDWVKDFKNAERGDRQALGLDVAPNGEATVVGYARTEKNRDDAVVIRFSASGDVRWANFFRGDDSFASNRMLRVAHDSVSGDPIVAGMFYSPQRPYALDVYRLQAASGSTVWKKEIQTPRSHSGTVTKMLAVSDGVLIGGSLDETREDGLNFLLIKMDRDGGTTFRTLLKSGKGKQDTLADFVVDQSGRIYMVGGAIVERARTSQIFTAALNPRGNVLWSLVSESQSTNNRPAALAVDWASGHVLTAGQADFSIDADQSVITLFQSPIAAARSFTVFQGDTLTVGAATGMIGGSTYAKFASLGEAKLTGQGEFKSQPDGSFTYAAPKDFEGQVTVDYTLTREGLRSSSNKITINVVKKPKEPKATSSRA